MCVCICICLYLYLYLYSNENLYLYFVFNPDPFFAQCATAWPTFREDIGSCVSSLNGQWFLIQNVMKLMFRYKLQVEAVFKFVWPIFVISFIDLFYLQNASWPNLQAGAPLSGFHLSIFLFLDNWYVFSSSLFIMFFLATLVALHFTPVSESVSQSVGRIFKLA